MQMSFLAVIGGADFNDMNTSQFPTYYIVLVVTYVVLVSVMLLNLLIAMMVRRRALLVELNYPASTQSLPVHVASLSLCCCRVC
jgi:uncharacterized integral membrane protein